MPKNPKVTLCIPSYNEERIIKETLLSALSQDYDNLEVLVINDAGTDRTVEIVKQYPAVRLIVNEKNLGVGKNLTKLMKEARGEYIIFLCADDVFTYATVVSDMVKIFEDNPSVGVIGRPYYQYLDGYDGAVMTIRTNIYISSCQPSGIGFRKRSMLGEFSTKLMVEVPSMVANVIKSGWNYTMMDYDTVAARLHPGEKGNAATNPAYFRVYPRQSPTLNWCEVTGEPFIYSLGLIQLKNRCPELLWDEIWVSIKIEPLCVINPKFIICALIALIVPGRILREFSNFYRHRITRYFVKIKERK